jgi:transaldolase
MHTASVKEMREAAGLAELDGVTTHPSFVANEGHSVRNTLVEICHPVRGIARIQGDS